MDYCYRVATLDFIFMIGQQARKPGIIESSVKRLYVAVSSTSRRCIDQIKWFRFGGELLAYTCLKSSLRPIGLDLASPMKTLHEAQIADKLYFYRNLVTKSPPYQFFYFYIFK